MFALKHLTRAALIVVILCGSAALAPAAWFTDRDNSTTPLPRAHPQFDAFVTVATTFGVSQGVQVCPNVYLATAHGVADVLNGGLELPQHWIKIIQYPMADLNFFDLETGNFELTTDYLDRIGRSRSQRDYAFFSVDPGLSANPDIFIRPIETGNDAELVALAQTGAIDVISVRPPPSFFLTPDGFVDFERGVEFSGLDESLPLYSTPRFTAQRCEISVRERGDLINTDCPSEPGVSGSGQVVEIDGVYYLASMHIQGANMVIDAEVPDFMSDNVGVQSRHFCEDYEAVCGQPCAELLDLVEPRDPEATFLNTRRARIAEACENGWPACQTSAYSLALEARHGTDQMPRDPALALDLLHEAAANGSAPASLDLAFLYEAAITDASAQAEQVWQGISEARQRTVLDLRALFELAADITPDAEIAAEFHIAALEAGLNTMLYRDADDWPNNVAQVLQEALAARGLYQGAIDGRIGPSTLQAMERLCQCET